MIRSDRPRAIMIVPFLALLCFVSLYTQPSVQALQATSTPSADFNGDLEVNFGDFLLFATAFGTTDARFDLSGDGAIDFADFLVFATQFGQTVEPPDPEPEFPEPILSVVLADTANYEVFAAVVTDDQGLATLESTELARSIEVTVTGIDASPVDSFTVRGVVLNGTLLVVLEDTSGSFEPTVVQGVPEAFATAESGAIEIEVTVNTVEESAAANLEMGDGVTELVGFTIAEIEDVSWAVDTYKGPAIDLVRVMDATIEGGSAVISVGLRDTLGSTLNGLMAADRRLFEWTPAEEDSIDTATVDTLLARGYGDQVTVALDDSTEAYLLVHQWSSSLAPHDRTFELILPAESGTQPPPPLSLSEPVSTVALADTLDYSSLEQGVTNASGLVTLTSDQLERDIEVVVKDSAGAAIPNLTVSATVLNGSIVVVVEDTTGTYPAAIVAGLPDTSSLNPEAAAKPASFVVEDRTGVFAGSEFTFEIVAIELSLLSLTESADSGLTVAPGLVEMSDFLAGDFANVSWSVDTYEATLSQLARAMNDVTAGASCMISIGSLDTLNSTIPGLVAGNRRLFDWTDDPTTSEVDTLTSEALVTLVTRAYGDQLTETPDGDTVASLLLYRWDSALAPYVFGFELILPATAGTQPPPPTPPELQLSTLNLAVEGSTSATIDLQNLGTELLTWTVTEEVSWLDITTSDASTVDTTGIAGEGEVELSMNTSTSNLDGDVFEAFIEVSSNGGDATVRITLSVDPPTGMNILGFTFHGTLNGHSYYLSEESTTWRDSKSKAEELGGYLAVISTEEESGFAEAAAREASASTWVGMTDEAEQDTWVGVVDEGSVFLNWDRHAPSSNDGEDFAVFDSKQDFSLNDVANTETHRFLVEFAEGDEPIERPMTIVRQFENPSGREVEMVKVPEGEFTMGSTSSSDEQPVHTVFLDTYYIDRFEVTNEAYAEFLTAHGSMEDGNGNLLIDLPDPDTEIRQVGDTFSAVSAAVEDKPAIEISWYGASEYCAWTGGRLPTEAEWEKAARGPRGRTYPWGETDPSSSLAIFNTTGRSDVGSVKDGRSPYGAFDMTGNVWEWTQDWYESDYYEQSPSSNPTGPSSGTTVKTARGGSWKSESSSLRAPDRGRPPITSTGDVWGVRCVREVPAMDP